MITIILWVFGAFSAILFILMKIELQSRHPHEDFIFHHHFSFWSEYMEIYSNEKDSKLKNKYRFILYSFSLSTIIFSFALLLSF